MACAPLLALAPPRLLRVAPWSLLSFKLPRAESFRHARRPGGGVQALTNGNGGPSLDLVLLDLNLPKRDGWEVLEELRSVTGKHSVPVVILSSSSAPQDVARAESLGVLKYIRKPSTLDEFMAIGQKIRQFWPVSGQ